MLKQTVSYTDWDGNPQTEDLYFNLSKSEIAESIGLEDRLTEMQAQLTGDERDLTKEEVRDILGLVRDFVKMSYGKRDGNRFLKTEEVWEDFRYGPAYDEFVFGLFQDPTKAMQFLLGVIPQDIRAQAEAQMNQPKLEFDAPQDGRVIQPAEEAKDAFGLTANERVDAASLTAEEILRLTPEQLEAYKERLKRANKG